MRVQPDHLPPAVFHHYPRRGHLGQIDAELHAAAGGDHVGVMAGTDVWIDAQRDRIGQTERQDAVDLRHGVDVDDDALVTDGAEIVVGNVRASEPDPLRREPGPTGQEDLARRHAITPEAGVAHQAEDGQRAVGFHGVEGLEGEGSEGGPHPLDLRADGGRVVHVERRAESFCDVDCGKPADPEHLARGV